MTYYNGRWHLYSEAERKAYGEAKRQAQREKLHAVWISKAGMEADATAITKPYRRI